MTKYQATAIKVLSVFTVTTTMLLVAATAGIAVSSCTPAQREAARTVVKAAEATCVLIEQRNGDATDEVCAKAEELAPFVRLILSSRRKPRTLDAGVVDAPADAKPDVKADVKGDAAGD